MPLSFDVSTSDAMMANVRRRYLNQRREQTALTPGGELDAH